ncbi:dihydroorotate dehydrogenase electron transfer subunit [Clostridium saccharoperbutylacetonicum]|jgi:dihydroorotate dehydrogenase electron transfer subunit|uniref:Dihydroorotate dehydrogenase B (NAD(+)), electron transfer subunit n=1 Tax=Clostridium saccharoperbutylacetonicum N1-4(HMT) TaxID=931276 RepID=M1MJ45_9CLOT|nr:MULTISPECIES: dihydroorotate dehydrogenase electron transfer subunit [Clostridium]AGF54866.1 dihydroorotate dehydrogenase B (NAD(+)), electron transfer subunit PyrK [Clostridium saccharoperbutylacetonicum N1-4(HMT)]NRT64429.1 dihydroorotate dehydrogenase electron transfer subunit [Clostridium saccharoperbutylacetonicum]NSB27800.1 dihydroorotate dehydrogenase electron transfer subunit [Clostridium saccharoperbutylacetonicum]NSB41285.1 dihydroorotate dehydrogenase electron transfer subunit [Cl
MAITYRNAKVISNEEISKDIYKLVVEDDSEIKAGQFYMLKINGVTFLPRPISICEKTENRLTFLYAVVGEGTKEYKMLKKDDFINITGPLGNGFDIEKNYNRVALVAGGIGTAPMLELAKKLRKKDKNQKIDLYAGFRDEIYLIDELKEYVDEISISTNTGKHGHKGFITELLKPENYDTVLCCGPEIMMKKVVDMCKEKNVSVYVSMEKHMACGVGACLVCTCKTKDGHKRTCKDGPVFDGYYVEL